MRWLITADLHYNHGKSRGLADELIDRMNSTRGDGLLVIGDTASFDGDALERCLNRFTINGPKLLVAGNHELWTLGPDSYHNYRKELPRRAQAIGWQWLEDQPFVTDRYAIVGSIGWYDYSFAQPDLKIPLRFYEHKISPGAAERFSEFAFLFQPSDDIPSSAREIVARWNDGRYVKLSRSDYVFLNELLIQLEQQLAAAGDRQIIAAIHHLPFRELLPPPHSAQWDFAKAYLGSDAVGRLLLKYPRVSHVFCGHSHFGVEKNVGHVRAINIGSGYRSKTFHTLDLPD